MRLREVIEDGVEIARGLVGASSYCMYVAVLKILVTVSNRATPLPSEGTYLNCYACRQKPIPVCTP